MEKLVEYWVYGSYPVHVKVQLSTRNKRARFRSPDSSSVSIVKTV